MTRHPTASEIIGLVLLTGGALIAAAVSLACFTAFAVMIGG